MPFVNLWLRDHHDADHKRAVSDSIHRAMVDVLGITDDDRFHNFHPQRAEDMIQDASYADRPRSGDSLFVQFYFTQRTPALKQTFFAAVVANLTASPGLGEDDIYLNIVEPAPENWWIAGREVDPETGFDVRMADAVAGQHVVRGP